MSTWHFTLALTIGTYAYVLLPDWVGMALAVSFYVVWYELQDDAKWARVLDWWKATLKDPKGRFLS